MRRRLLFTCLSLAAVLLLALEIPQGLGMAMNRLPLLAISRPGGTGSLTASAAAAVGTSAPGTGRSAGTRAAEPPFLAELITHGGRVTEAVAAITPTMSPPSGVTAQNWLLFLVGLVSLASAVVIAVPLSCWSLRPIQRLQSVVQQIAEGRYGVRASADCGPRELRELAQGVNSMTDRLVALLEAQQSFIADASHQLRNPLTALRVRLETLEGVVAPEGRPHLRLAVAEADRLGSILEELLALARASGSGLGATTIEVRAVAEARARAWSEQAAQAGITIAVRGERAAAQCLPGALDQALDVLLDNALGFSPPEGRITVRTWTEETTVHVSVEDQGPGMTSEDRARATERFWRGSQPEGRGGSGLGLAIATALLAVGDGRLELSDATPHGLVAEVILPRSVRRPAGSASGTPREPVAP